MVAIARSLTDADDNGADDTTPVIRVSHLCRQFRDKLALSDVSLELRPGTVMGLVGENGAGKTTLIKHILGLLKAQAGKVRVFGLDPTQAPTAVLSRIGYLSEEPELPGWMRVHELIRYVSAFYPGWDHEYANELQREFELDLNAKVKNLSKGQRARAGLLVALAYRPPLLVLDEPSSGLDPIVRRDILGAIVRTIADEGRTVLFSSHLLAEVERVCDRVAMIRNGRVLFCDSLEDVKRSHVRLTLRFDQPRTAPPTLDGALTWHGSGLEWTTVYTGATQDLPTAASGIGARLVEQASLSLDEIFLARAGAVAHGALSEG